MKIRLLITGVLISFVLLPAWAAEESAEQQAIRTALMKVLPHTVPDSIEPSPVPGMYEVVIGASLYYVSADGRYLLRGNVIDLQTREDLTAKRMGDLRADALKQVADDQMVIFKADKPQHTVTIFTDIDCGYCRKLHNEMDQYNAKGISVRYLFFPRAGLDSPSYDKAVSVWCADDRNEAMTDAKAGKEVKAEKCDNPVKQHYELGEAMGVQGTPAIIMESGELVPGYVPANRLIQVLEAGDLQAAR